ncbi:hypothetical protein HZU73_09594 [Apis mellifera caucasica]|uniref:Uncharacterized protein LOC100576262 n=1 Tax=Apis mellifera TaxID=7460 RepID=A0A7M7GS68_APIME|nr:uncharacterized protein LOC100576262 [Apis mellifera]KAG6795144.1 hypothetical protein HZU73_09594 [Apis mellifera caucasica]KAG9428559.1 hypothetical protein HZU67_09962 [Apis mellifera carnica]|eukprot:XP_006560760.1 uncharacterized protein LOC100576262 [Apis mellifera]
MQQSMKYNLSKSRNSSKKPVEIRNKQDNNPSSSIHRSKSNVTMNRDKNRRTSKNKARLSAKLQSDTKIPSDERLSIETMRNWDLEEKAKMSEASQTAEARSAVVMEYSTVQKIVQILDNEEDILATKMAMKELNSKPVIEEKKPTVEILNEPQFELVQALPEFETMPEEHTYIN